MKRKFYYAQNNMARITQRTVKYDPDTNRVLNGCYWQPLVTSQHEYNACYFETYIEAREWLISEAARLLAIREKELKAAKRLLLRVQTLAESKLPVEIPIDHLGK